MSRRAKTKPAFTIVETVISVAFIAILLIAIGTVSSHIVKTYHRGIIIKAVNDTGYAIGEDIRKSARSGSISSSDYRSIDDVYGVFCTGSYSYVWNYANEIQKKSSKLITFDGNGTVRLAKLVDRSHYLCSDAVVSNHNTISGLLKLGTATGDSRAIEIIKSSDNDLMIHDFYVKAGLKDSNSGQAIYKATFLLGTGSEGQITGNKQCDPAKHDQEYCAINKFEVSVLARER